MATYIQHFVLSGDTVRARARKMEDSDNWIVDIIIDHREACQFFCSNIEQAAALDPSILETAEAN